MGSEMCIRDSPLSSRKARALAASQAGQQVRVEARSGQPRGFPKTWARSGQPCGFPKNVGIFSLTQRTFLFFSVSIVLIFCVFTACAVLIVFLLPFLFLRFFTLFAFTLFAVSPSKLPLACWKREPQLYLEKKAGFLWGRGARARRNGYRA